MNYAINQNYAGVLKLTPAFTSSSTTWRVDVRFKLNVLNAWSVLINHTPNRFLTSLSARFTSDFFGRDEVTLRINSVDYKFNAANASQIFSDGEYHELSFICDGSALTCYRDGAQLSNSLACTASLSSFDCFGDARALAQDSSLERVAIFESTDTSAPVHIWDANSSDTSNTGAAPVLVDTVGSTNAIGDAAFPTDGTAWLSYTPPADVTPAAFPIAPLTDQPLSTVVESSPITVTGVDAATDIPISIVGGNYKVSTDGGSTYSAFTAASGNVQLNNQVIVNVLTSSSEGTTTTATLTIGGVSSDFNATTTAPPVMTIDQATASHGDTLTFTSEMLDGASAKLVDSSLNELAIANLTNNGDGTYSALIPALTDGLTGVEVGTLTLELTNGAEVASDTFDLVPPIGFTQIVAATQSGSLSPHDWGYVGVGGLDNPPITGDIVWNKEVSGLEAAVNGLYIFDFSAFTPPQTAELWLQDQATLTWTYISTTFVAEVSGPDVTKPVITLAGSSTINLTVGDNYTELGATANDNVDGDISANIVTSGSVNTSVAGTYYVYYNVSDAAGNAADRVTRTIVVSDVVISGPILSDLTFAASGSISGTVTTDTAAGTLYYLASENSSELVATVKSGSTQVVSSAGAQSISVSGLAEGTWYLHAVHNDGADDSAVSTSGPYIIGSGSGIVVDNPVKTIRAKTL